jgi:GMP synthase-like glutamine amidotransferase
MGRSNPDLTPPRLGLLACDSLWEPLRSTHGDYAEMYSAMLQEAGASFELVRFAAHEGEFPADVTACDAWLISGSRAAVYEDHPWIAQLADFARAVHAAGIPQVGVCFGHQLLAHALGGRTERAPGGWGIGNVELRLREPAAAPAGAPARFRLFMAHQDQVVALPPGAVWLAEAPHCAHAMFTLGGSVLGVQPHPEFTAGFMRDMTLEDSFGLPPPQRAEALASYAEPVDNALLGGWIADFLALRGGC